MAKARSRDKAIEDIRKRIIPIGEAKTHVKILAYALNGKGKTRFAASAPKCLLVDINEEGTMSARNFKGTNVLKVKKYEDVEYAYWMLKEGKHKYESVAIDNLTTLQHITMRHVLKEAEDRDPMKDPKTASMRDWGKLSEILKPLLLNFRNLPLHVIFLAQERIVTDDDAETTMRVPDMSPGPRSYAMGSVDIIGRIYQKEVRVVDKKQKKEVKKWESRMLVGPHDEYITKDRTGTLPRVIRNPTVGQIIDAAQSVQNEE